MRKILLIILIILCLNTKVLAAPFYYYPKEYNVTINNIEKNDIKKIEILYYIPIYGFNYSSSNESRSWIKDTNFGYKYKNYSDAEIIPTLTTAQIDAIANSYNHIDTSHIKGYWIEKKEIPTINTSIAKFQVNKNTNIKYNNKNIIVTYFSDKETYPYLDNMYLKIVKNDNTILYSNPISSSIVKVIDENTSPEEKKEKEKILNQTAYFEVDFSKIHNNFDVSEIFKKTNNNILLNYYLILIIVIISTIIIACVIIILFIKNNNKSKSAKN